MTTSGNFYVYEHWRLDRDECFYVGEAIQKKADALRGNPLSDSHKKKISESHKVKIVSDQTRQILSNAHKGKPWSAARRAAQEKLRLKKKELTN